MIPMTLYRKYRPQKLSELDSSEVKDRLIKIFSSSFTPHALLFAGTKGTGKTSAARIVAKVLNCEIRNKKQETRNKNEVEPTTNIEPCNKCENCISITEGRNLDVLEIDAASNRGIDEIRDLREKIKLTPVSLRFKVYIIDEVHMLTTEAFNALLKTLEEPPSHAVFILATTEAEKLPETILSRCIIFNFKKATAAEIIHCLTRVSEGEKVEIDNKLFDKIASAADGSFRDATKILEQAISENALSEEKLSVLLGRDSLTAMKFLELFVTNDLSKILFEINKISLTGANFRYLVEDVLKLLHQILLANHGINEGKINEEVLKHFDQKDVLVLIKLFSKVFVELKNTSIPQLPLEVAVVEWCTRKGGEHV